MFVLFLILSLLLFIAYFNAIGLWYLGIIPLLICIVFFVVSVGGLWKKEKVNSLFSEYGLYFAWIVILVGLFLILNFFKVGVISAFLFLFVVNILLLIGSYVFDYFDGKIISHIGFSFSFLFLIIYSLFVYGFNFSFDIFSLVWYLYIGVIAFVIFFLGLWYDIEDYVKYLLFVLIGGGVVIFLCKIIPDIYVLLVVLSFVLMGLYYSINYILTHKPPTKDQVKEISVRRILAGERVLQKIPQHNYIFQKIYDFVYNIPKIVKYLLEFVNTTIIILLIYLYFRNALSLAGSTEQFFYWIIMLCFIYNVYLLKKIDYTSIFQRLITYLVINFAIYISLFAAFRGDIVNISISGIIWNIISSVLVFRIHKTKIGQYLKKVDYMFWIFATILAMVVNIILLITIGMSWKLLVPIILLYLGVQCMLLYYSIKFVYKIKEVKLEDLELKV